MPDPITWAGAQKTKFVDYIDYELTTALTTHDHLVRQWIKWLEQYRAPAQQAVKNFPYEGAANFQLPMTATDVDQLYAKHIQTIHAPANVWTLAPLNERWVQAAKPLQDALTFLDTHLLKMYNVNKPLLF